MPTQQHRKASGCIVDPVNTRQGWRYLVNVESRIEGTAGDAPCGTRSSAILKSGLTRTCARGTGSVPSTRPRSSNSTSTV
ncbi:putative ferredoxin [Streptomyces himastatinicus ATCC 53653]|uniref:Putative ferredoxin n=1 Tax=Streptomyces himastatinicus ATCC 53653 TaxID=457427 RepID=D9WF76_9ACTN|nr:putative ferredoxin [Streptomyces himastatinicus ATCC 53653]